jgi:DNA polymerase-3 subunit delta
LQNAIGKKNIFKANQIINYFAANPKDNSIVLAITLLYSYFIKVLMYHQLTDKSQKNAAAILSIPPYFVSDYQTAAKNYSIDKIINIISLLREYDLKSKGVDNLSIPESELYKELIFKILH